MTYKNLQLGKSKEWFKRQLGWVLILTSITTTPVVQEPAQKAEEIVKEYPKYYQVKESWEQDETIKIIEPGLHHVYKDNKDALYAGYNQKELVLPDGYQLANCEIKNLEYDSYNGLHANEEFHFINNKAVILSKEIEQKNRTEQTGNVIDLSFKEWMDNKKAPKYDDQALKDYKVGEHIIITSQVVKGSGEQTLEKMRQLKPDGYQVSTQTNLNYTDEFGKEHTVQIKIYQNKVPVTVQGKYNDYTKTYIRNNFGIPQINTLDDQTKTHSR